MTRNLFALSLAIASATTLAIAPGVQAGISSAETKTQPSTTQTTTQNTRPSPVVQTGTQETKTQAGTPGAETTSGAKPTVPGTSEAGASTKTVEAAGASTDAATGTIVDVAAKAGSFTTLAKALEAAGLVDMLSGKGPFTVFAPTDEAFAALPKGTLDELLLPENRERLTKVLTYHVISGEVLSTDLKAGEVTTVEGSPLKISLTDGVMVNDAKVVTPDIKASNGVIHAIDKVILPPQK